MDGMSEKWRSCCHTRRGTEHLTECRYAPRPVEPPLAEVPLPPQPPLVEQGNDLFPDGFPQMPHCDQSVLHAPGECRFCDMHPEFQAYREVARINFTGHADDGMAPCPSEYFRPGELRDRWPGNVAAPEGQPAPSYFEPLTDQETYQAAAANATNALREAGYAAWYRGDPAGSWVESAELRPPVYPWYIRAYARLRWLAGKIR